MEKGGFTNLFFGERSKRAQVTVFIIIAIVIVAIFMLFFIFKDSLLGTGVKQLPKNLEPAYSSFLSCVDQITLTGASILGSQGGYIYPPEFEAGSQYMPFSSQLDFFGNPIPYWYYVSGNNLQKEQVPTKKTMENQLSQFVDENILDCSFNSFRAQGVSVEIGEPKTTSTIGDKEILVETKMRMVLKFENESIILSDHVVSVKSKVGKLYDSAKKVYDYEQSTLFLENYAVDTLRLYAPVDGVEISCSPKVWSAPEVFGNLSEAISANTLALKVKSGDYKLTNKKNKYFVIDLSVDENVNFLTSSDWPSAFEVDPTQGPLMVAKPIGTQQGLGILGFCYVPYHYVYNVKYPVLIQISDGTEIFQFPVAVVIQGNKPRQALDVNTLSSNKPELCSKMNTLVSVNTFSSNFEKIDAHISYECLGVKCDIGETSGGVLTKEFPQCVNGFVSVSSEDYQDARYLLSTTSETNAEIILNKLYEEQVELFIDSVPYNGKAIVSFVSENSSTSISYPDQKNVRLAQGQYEVQVYIYKDSSITLEGTTTQECIKVPQQGVGGLFGLETEKCFDVEIPQQIVSNVLAGGGKQNVFILENDLANSKKIQISVNSLPVPNDLKSLENNYLLFERRGASIELKP